MSDILRWGSASFPEKQWFWGRASSGFKFVLRHRRSAALGLAAVFGLAACVYLGIFYVRYQRLVTADQAAVARAQSANADLQDALARLRDQVGAADQALGMAKSRIASLSDDAQRQNAFSEQAVTSKADRIAQLTRALEQAQREFHLAEAQRVTLMARFSKAEAELAEGLTRQQQAQVGLDQWQKKVQQLTADRDKAASERDHLRARVSELEQKHSMQQTRQPPRPVAEARPEPAVPVLAGVAPASPAPAMAAAGPASPAPAVVMSAAAPAPAAQAPAAPAPAVAMSVAAPVAAVAVSRGGLAQFERVLASAGVDVAHLFSQFGVTRGEGGPFIAAPRGQHPDTSLSPEKFAALHALVKALPVSAPLQGYEIGSPFGVRGDPINGRRAYHTGLDFRAPYMSPVYATAPGVVTYSGYRDDYGKIVEIDHGHGIATRYAHLHRAIVSVGQRVAGQMQIGFLGSTGRATGPHVHYEVLVNGEPQDPEKFLSLARLVPVVRR